MLILDASVIVKWVLPEKDSEAALQIREKFVQGLEHIIVPPLLFYEVLSACCAKEDVTTEMIESYTQNIFLCRFEVYPISENDMVSCAKIARDYGVSVYDAAYVALAEKLKCPLVTADEKFAKKMSRHPQVRLLSKYE